jgi:membrane-bound metal-dependent hydrolase YbcI (DUF457 family)
MLGVSHALSGAVVGLGACVALAATGHPIPPPGAAAVIGGVTVGALLPDLDSRSSIISTLLSPTALLARSARAWGCRVQRRRHPGMLDLAVARVAAGWRPRPLLHLATVALSRAVFRATATSYDQHTTQHGEPAGGHRYLTHTIAFAAACGVVVSALAAAAGLWWWLGIPLAAGCLVHLAGDWITVAGVPALWPIRHRGKRWWRYRLPLTRLHAGGWVEQILIAPALAACLVVELVALAVAA